MKILRKILFIYSILVNAFVIVYGTFSFILMMILALCQK